MHVNNNADLKLFLRRWMTTSSAGATISRRMLACASLIDLFQIFCMSDHAMIDVLEHNAGKKWLLTKDVESFPTLLVIIHFVALLTLLIRSNSPGFWFQQRISLTMAVLLLYRLYNTVLCTSSGGSRLRIARLALLRCWRVIDLFCGLGFASKILDISVSHSSGHLASFLVLQGILSFAELFPHHRER